MKYILTLLVVCFSLSISVGQAKTEKVSRKEAKSLIKELNNDEKVRLLNQLIKNDEKLIDKALSKALKSGDKAVVDRFIERKNLVFKPMDRNNKVKKAAKPEAPKKVEKATKTVTKTANAAKTTTTTKTTTATKTVNKKAAIATKKATANVKQQAKKAKVAAKPKADAHAGHDHAGHNHAKEDAEKKKPTFVFKDKNAGSITSIKFEETTHNFGEIKDGEVITYTYKFTNTGDKPYFISNAKGSCGCTVPKWPKEPIKPGEQGEIVVTFNSRGKGKVGGGQQSKRVTLTGNTDPANTYLTIKGVVTKDK